jgi:hypothetical protein
LQAAYQQQRTYRLDELLSALTGNTGKEKKKAKVMRKKPAGKK